MISLSTSATQGSPGHPVGEVAKLLQVCSLSNPDRWTFELRQPATDRLPIPGAVLELPLPGREAPLRLTLLRSDYHAPSRRARLIATRLDAPSLGYSIRGCQQGLLPSILEQFSTCLELSPSARQALQNVQIHCYCRMDWQNARGGETVGQFLRRLVGLLAAERGIALRFKAADTGKLQLIDPLRDHVEHVKAQKTTTSGHGDPLAFRPARSRLLESWHMDVAAGLQNWLAAADLVSAPGTQFVTRFEGRWSDAGQGHHGQSVRFRRHWGDVSDWIASQRQQTTGSHWNGLARMGKAAKVEGQNGDFFEVEPLVWSPGESKPLPIGKMIAQLATPYAGNSAKSCGFHVVPEVNTLVWLEASSIFDRPIILGNIRAEAAKRKVFGVYLPRSKNWQHQSAELYVRAQSKFSPPEN